MALKEGVRCKNCERSRKRPNVSVSTFRCEVQLRVAKLEGRVIVLFGTKKVEDNLEIMNRPLLLIITTRYLSA